MKMKMINNVYATLTATALLAAPLSAQTFGFSNQTINAPLTTPSGGLIKLGINNTPHGSPVAVGTSGWTGNSGGDVYAGVKIPLLFPLPDLDLGHLELHGYTAFRATGDEIAFGLTMDGSNLLGTAGTLVSNLTGLGVGVLPTWEASLDLSSLSPNTTYQFDFDLYNSSGVLTGIDANVLDNFTLVFTNGAPINLDNNLLGLTSINGGTDHATHQFTTGADTSGLALTFAASGVVSSTTSLLGGILQGGVVSNDIYKISNFSVTPVPETSTAFLLSMAGMTLLIRRRR